MLDFFQNIDVSLLYFVNKSISNGIFDKFFLFITNVKHWYLVYIIFWLMMIIKGNRKKRILAISIVLLIIFSDQLSSHLIKNLVARVRPCHIFNDLNLLTSCKNSFSFPSSHSVNNFAAAYFLSSFFPNYRKVFYMISISIAVSRVYVGVHYPSDVIAGAIIGILIGYLFYIVTKRFYLLLFKENINEN